MPILLEKESLEENAALCSKLGLSFLELNQNLPEYLPKQIELEQAMKWMDQYQIYYTLHLDESMDVCCFDAGVAEAYERTALQSIQLAKKLRAPLVNMHLAAGCYFTMPEKRVYLYERYQQHYLHSLSTFADHCMEEIGDSGIVLSVENTWGFALPYRSMGVQELLKRPCFRLTFDIGHNAGSGGTDEYFIREHAKKLAHFHFHDAIGGRDHLALGEGALDLPSYFELAEKHGCRGVLETKTVEALVKSVAWVREHGILA